MESAFGVEHGDIAKVAKPKLAGLKPLKAKAGKLFGRAGQINRHPQPGTAFKAGHAAGTGVRQGVAAVGTGAGQGVAGAGFKRLGEAMQRSPVKAGVTTSFLAGGAGYAAYNQQQKKKTGQQL